MKRGLLIVISGPSGSGKSTIVKRLKESGQFTFSVSATTRSPREGEINGVHYHFISREQFEQDIKDGKFLEFSNYVGNYYGTYVDQVENALSQGQNIILEIEVLGATQVKSKMPDAVMIILLPPSMKQLEERLRNRQTETEEQIKQRLERVRYELANFGHYDYVIINENNQREKAVDDIMQIVRIEKMKTSRNMEISTNFFKEEKDDYDD